MMLIVGDVGGATTQLALVLAAPQAGARKFVAEQHFGSAGYQGLQPIGGLRSSGARAFSTPFQPLAGKGVRHA